MEALIGSSGSGERFAPRAKESAGLGPREDDGMTRRRSRWSFSVVEALEERVVQSSATVVQTLTVPAAVSTSSVKSRSLPPQANFSARGVFTLNAVTGANGPDELQVPVAKVSGPLAKLGFTEAQGVFVTRQAGPNHTFFTSGTLQLLSPRGTLDLQIRGEDVGFNNGTLGLITSTSRLSYTAAHGTGSFVNVNGSGKLNILTIGFFSTTPQRQGQSISGKVDITLLPDLRDRATDLPMQLGGSLDVMKRSTTVPTGLSGTRIVDNMGGSGKVNPLGSVKITGNFDQPNADPATADATGKFTLSNAQGSVTLAFSSLGQSATNARARKYAVTIVDSTGIYAGATGAATALLVPVKNLSYTLQFGPASRP
jgi:hypothetical protein